MSSILIFEDLLQLMILIMIYQHYTSSRNSHKVCTIIILPLACIDYVYSVFISGWFQTTLSVFSFPYETPQQQCMQHIFIVLLG